MIGAAEPVGMRFVPLGSTGRVKTKESIVDPGGISLTSNRRYVSFWGLPLSSGPATARSPDGTLGSGTASGGLPDTSTPEICSSQNHAD